jgi:hypothetical protein
MQNWLGLFFFRISGLFTLRLCNLQISNSWVQSPLWAFSQVFPDSPPPSPDQAMQATLPRQ